MTDNPSPRAALDTGHAHAAADVPAGERPEAARSAVASGSVLAVALKRAPNVSAAPGAVLSKLIEDPEARVDGFALSPAAAFEYGVRLIQASFRAEEQLEELQKNGGSLEFGG